MDTGAVARSDLNGASADGRHRRTTVAHTIFGLLREDVDRVIALAWACMIVCLILSAVLSALGPVALKLGIDAMVATHAKPALAPTAIWLTVYLATLLLVRVLNELRTLALGRIEQRLQSAFLARVFQRLLHVPIRFHLDNKNGAITQAVANGAAGAKLILQHTVTTILPPAMEIVGMVFVLVSLQHYAFIALLVAVLGADSLIVTHGVRRIVEPARSASAAQVTANGILADSLLHSETIKCCAAESLSEKWYGDALEEAETRSGMLRRRKAIQGVLVSSVHVLGLAITTAASAWGVVAGSMTVGDFVLVHTYMLQILRPLESIGVAVRDLAQGVSFFERALEFLAMEPERSVAPLGPLPIRRGEIAFSNVWFGYGGEMILKGVSLTVAAGKRIGVVGASGCGKSTLVRLLVRLFEPCSGSIHIDGVPLAEMPLRNLRRAIAIVSQDTALLHDTIFQNIGLGRPEATSDDIEHAARIAQVFEFAKALPDGLGTVVGERGLKLSGGERQRIAIARAILKRPSVFIFDEATSSLDSRTEREILRQLDLVSRGTTTIIVAHRLATVVDADEIVVMDAGRIAERGTHAGLLTRNGAYAALWAAHRPERNDADRAEAAS